MIRIGSIVFDCTDFERTARFWAAALHYMPREPPTTGWVVLTDPLGKGPNVSVNLDPEATPRQNLLHLDLYSDDPEAEVQRLLALGATLHRAREEGEDFTVLADPGGNLFCVVDVR